MKSKIIGYAIGPIGAAAIGLITLPIITKHYTAEDIGRISMLQVVISFSVLLFCFGLDQAYVREYHEANSKPRLLKATIFPCIYFSITFFSLIYFVAPLFISKLLYGIPSSYLTLVSFFCIICSITSRFLSLVLRMQERAFSFSMSQLLPRVLFLVLILGTLYFGYVQDTYNLITAHTLSIVTVFLIFSWNTREELLLAFRSTIDMEYLKKLLIFGFPLVIGGVAAWGLNVLDRFFLRWMSSFSELGIYSVAMTIASGATIFASIFNIIWSPMVYKWIKDGIDLKRVDEISEHLLASFYFIVVLSGLFSWTLPLFFPEEYQPIENLVTTCLFGPLLYTLSEATAIGITISRRTIFSMLSSVIAVFANAIGNFLLIPKYGAAGASVSTAISFTVFYICRTEFSRHVWRSMPRQKSYIVISSLLLVATTDTLILKGNQISIISFAMLFLLGFFLFKKSVLHFSHKAKLRL